MRTLVAIAAAAVVLAYAGFLTERLLTHRLLVNPQGQPIASDFLAVWSAGNLAQNGEPSATYVPALQHAAEEKTLGRPLQGRYDWPYPPFYFFVVIPLAYLGFVQAFIVWNLVTLSGFSAVAAAVVRSRGAILFALAAPWTLSNVLTGQNGLFTAALAGLVFLSLEERPVLSGVLLGFLAYKPQFGLLFPIALAAGGYWRPFLWAAASVFVLLGLSSVVFPGALLGFLHAITTTSQSLLLQGLLDWNRFQSIYGLARSLGLASAIAWSAQITVTTVSAVAIVLLWRSQVSISLKAAGLSVAALLATPYVFVYDMALLSVSIAFLQRGRSLDGLEWALIGFSLFEVGGYMLFHMPTGWFATVTIGVLVLRRVIQKLRPSVSHQTH